MNRTYLRLTTALVGVAFSSAAAAGLQVTAFGGTPGFDQLMAKEYQNAAVVLQMPNYDANRFARHANLCVSKLMTNDLEGARSSCDRALRTAPEDLSSSLVPLYHRRSEVMTHLYCNRGVVRVLQGDMAGATADFEHALRLDSSNEKARLNLEYIAANDVAAN